jgi:hypothetical protein
MVPIELPRMTDVMGAVETTDPGGPDTREGPRSRSAGEAPVRLEARINTDED